MSATSLTRGDVLASSVARGTFSLLVGQFAVASGSSTIRPFRISVPEEQLAELRHRENGHRSIPRRAARDDAGTRAILGHGFRLGKVKALLNALPQFVPRSTG